MTTHESVTADILALELTAPAEQAAALSSRHMMPIDELLGAPSDAEVKRASEFLLSIPHTTTALLAIVAVLRGEFDVRDQALLLEGICEDFAELELQAM